MNYSNIDCKHLICKCEKKEVEKKIFIQCIDCIHGQYRYSREPDCPCTDKIVNILVCEDCDKIRERMNELYYQLDDVLYNLSDNIHNCIDITELMNCTLLISTQLREYDSILRQKM